MLDHRKTFAVVQALYSAGIAARLYRLAQTEEASGTDHHRLGYALGLIAFAALLYLAVALGLRWQPVTRLAATAYVSAFVLVALVLADRPVVEQIDGLYTLAGATLVALMQWYQSARNVVKESTR